MVEAAPRIPEKLAVMHNPSSEGLSQEYYARSKELVNLRLHDARERFLQERGTDRGRLAYIPEFDFAPYNELFGLRDKIDPVIYQETLTSLQSETDFHITTLLGEMFNAGLSQYNYRINEGKIYSPYSDEPFLDVMKRGQKIRAQNGSRVVDREAAEIEGFTKIQTILCDEATPVGTMMVSFSPPDEVYPHRFCDKHTLKVAADGKRYIESRRYATVLGNEEFSQKVASFDSKYAVDEVPDASFFLANPVQFTAGKTQFRDADALHQYFQAGHGGGISEEQFRNVVLPVHQGFKDKYLQRLSDSTMTDAQRLEAFKALLIKAQQFADELKAQSRGSTTVYQAVGHLPSDREISIMAMQQFNGMSLPCGDLFGSGIGGVTSAYGGAFGAAAFGGFGYGGSEYNFESDQYGSLYFVC